MAEPIEPQLSDCLEKAFGQDGDLARALVEAFSVDFIEPLKEKLQTIKFAKLIARKNPYLYRASGIETVEELVDRALRDFLSSSTEGLFGRAMERFVTALPGCIKSSAEGVDVEKRVGDAVDLYAIKSGPAGYNSASMKTQRRNLVDARARLQQQRGMAVNTYIGFVYGRKRTGKPILGIITLSSKELWHRLADDPTFFERLLEATRCVAGLYQGNVEAARQRLIDEAYELFSENNRISWRKILRQCSG